MHEDLRPDLTCLGLELHDGSTWIHHGFCWGQHSGGKDCTSPIFGMSWSLITLFLFKSWIGLRGLVFPNCVILWFASCKCQTKGGYHAHLKIHENSPSAFRKMVYLSSCPLLNLQLWIKTSWAPAPFFLRSSSKSPCPEVTLCTKGSTGFDWTNRGKP